MRFLLSQQAQTALNQLWDYYYQRGGTSLADRILGEIYTAIKRLIEHPGLGHYRPDLTDKPLRFYRVYRIFLIYDPASSPPYIARIYHSAQDISARMETDQS
ncbi:MAG TPA: type II toxin-antitoxin system RelE/ParE family toxin [Tepidisphaeraceae bacterium]|jgi:plasmid stabilization system protein ParE